MMRQSARNRKTGRRRQSDRYRSVGSWAVCIALCNKPRYCAIGRLAIAARALAARSCPSAPAYARPLARSPNRRNDDRYSRRADLQEDGWASRVRKRCGPYGVPTRHRAVLLRINTVTVAAHSAVLTARCSPGRSPPRTVPARTRTPGRTRAALADAARRGCRVARAPWDAMRLAAPCLTAPPGPAASTRTLPHRSPRRRMSCALRRRTSPRMSIRGPMHARREKATNTATGLHTTRRWCSAMTAAAAAAAVVVGVGVNEFVMSLACCLFVGRWVCFDPAR